MRGTKLILFTAIFITGLIACYPIVSLFFTPTNVGSVHSSGAQLTILLRTVLWSLAIGVTSTAIGWPLGLRIASLQARKKRCVAIVLMVTLALPSYTVFYAWWQLWPAGTYIHQLIVEHQLMPFAMGAMLALSLVCWSWPIAALVAGFCVPKQNSLQVLQQIDGVNLSTRITQQLQSHFTLMLICVVLVAAITSANTTCFDLAQIPSIGNELRAIVSSGESVLTTPLLLIGSICFAVFAVMMLNHLISSSRATTLPTRQKKIMPLVLVWIAISAGPIVFGAIYASTIDSQLLFTTYGGDILRSFVTACFVSICCVLILLCSSVLHCAVSHGVKRAATYLDWVWIGVALLPTSMIVEGEVLAWNHSGFNYIYNSTMILVFAQTLQFGFIGSLAGRWVASHQQTRQLLLFDAPKRLYPFLMTIRTRLFAAVFLVVAFTIAMSMGEISLTNQLAHPATDQPIAIALLNAMHYQRPQIVTSVLLLFVVVAIVAGCVVYYSMRHVVVLLVCMFLICCSGTEIESEQKIIVPHKILGGSGVTNARFVTPRAVDYGSDVIVVIDKTGRLQRFDKDGQFLSSWDLPPTGNGFPTGVTLDDEGNTWIADTHGHRVRVLDQEGHELLLFGSYGTGDGQFLYPTDVVIDRDGLVFVSEYGGNDRISVFDRSGSFIRSFGHHGKDPLGFRRPQSLAVHRESGALYIADSANHRIVVYDTDGTYVREFGQVGSGKGELLYPYSIIELGDGTLLVVEFGNNRLQQFTQTGESLGVWGRAGAREGEFKTPWGAVVVEDNILVIDTGNNRLQFLDGFMM
ncbi:MAG: 6-bladed beta-propeller [Phycisphaerales bacterium]|nr:6-bladed beta-propeller [Phycisphaerales bacterium]